MKPNFWLPLYNILGFQQKKAMNAFRHITSVVQKTLGEFQMIPENCRVLAAVSGGADSVLMALVMNELGVLHGIAHCNYQLRGEESDREAFFVKSFAESLSVPFYNIEFQTRSHTEASGDSLQVVARNLRYDFFERIMDAENFQVCATAHHQNDQAETILMSFVKGFSPEIIKGIPWKRERYIRPLLKTTRIEIENALKEKNQPYCIDSSNLKEDYYRNKLRNSVFPHLTELNPSVGQTLENKLTQYQLQTKLIRSVLSPYLNEGNELNFVRFLTGFGAEFLPLLIQNFLEKHHIYGQITTQITELADKETGKFVPLDGYRKIVRSRTGLSLIEENLSFETHVSVSGFSGEKIILIDNHRIIITNPCNETPVFGRKNVFYLDAEKIGYPMIIRRKKTGDTMTPFGMKGEKKLSDIITDEKFTPAQKQNLLVFADKNEKIIALSDFRISDSVAITQHTRTILKIEIMHKN